MRFLHAGELVFRNGLKPGPFTNRLKQTVEEALPANPSPFEEERAEGSHDIAEGWLKKQWRHKQPPGVVAN